MQSAAGCKVPYFFAPSKQGPSRFARCQAGLAGEQHLESSAALSLIDAPSGLLLVDWLRLSLRIATHCSLTCC